MKKIIYLFLSLLSVVGHAQLAQEGFEGTWTTGQGPANWKILQNSVGTTTTWVQSPLNSTTILPYEDLHCAYLDKQNVSSGIPEDYLITPLFNVPVNAELRFYSRLTFQGDQGGIYKIKILPQGADADNIANYIDVQTWTELELNPEQQVYREVLVNIPAVYVGTQARIAFVMQAENADRWFIDNVKVTSLCEAPTNLAVSNVTLNSANLSWDSPTGVTEWEIEYVKDDLPTTGAGNVYTGSLPYSISNLEYGTSYKYFVRSKCDDSGISAWQGPFYFKTINYGDSCAAPLIVGSLPYYQPNDTANFADLYNGTPGTCVPFPANYLSGNDVVYAYTATFNGIISIKANNLSSNTGGLFVFTSCSDIGTNCYAGDTAGFSDHMEITEMQVTSGTTYYILLSSQYSITMQYQLTIQQESCDPPTGLSSLGATTNSLNFTWQEAGTATDWQYKLQPYGAGVPTTAGINTNQTNVNVNGLPDSTIYDLYVRANCGDGTFSSWAGPQKLYTACGVLDLPIIEGFNTNSQTEYCWKIIDNDNNQNTWSTNTGYSFYEGNEAASFFVNNTANDDYLISPAVNLTGNQRLKFQYKNNSDTSNASFSVLMSTTGTDPEDFTTVIVPMASYSKSGYIEKVVNLNSFPQGPVYFAWKIGTGEIAAELFIDQVIIEDHPACSEPYDITLTEIGSDSVNLSWTQGNAETNWEVIVQNQNAAPPVNSTAGTALSVTNYLKTGLTPNSLYSVYVRSKCGANGNSLWVGPITFRTDCVAFDLPFHEGFETYSLTKFCWQTVNNNGDANNYWNYIMDPFDGDQAMSVYDADDTDDWLISPQINLTGNQRLKYNYKTSGGGGFKVLLSTTGNNPADFTEVLIPDTAYINTAYLEKKISLLTYNGPVFVAFQALSGSTTGNVYIDNVIVEDFPLCTEPDNLSWSNITSSSAELSWTQGLSEQDWEVLVQSPGDDVPTATSTGEPAPDTTFVKTGLSPNTSYEYYVRSACGANGNSIWMGPVQFKTACAAFDVPFYEGFNTDSQTIDCWTIVNVDNDPNYWQPLYDAFEGDRSMYVYDDATNNDWLITPQINLTGNQRLKFHYKSSSDDTAFSILISTTGRDIEDFTQVLVPETVYEDNNFTEKKIALAGYSGPVYIAWVLNQGGQFSTPLVIDNVIIEDQPLCTEPLGLAVNNITSSSALLSWSQGFNETNWEVLVQPKDGPAPDASSTGEAAPDTTFAKNGLSANTAYEFYVRSDCDANGNSIWIGPVAFTTACAPFDIPYLEEFEADSATQACWEALNINGGGTWNMDVPTSWVYPNQQAVIDTDYPDNNDFLVSPQINLTGNQRLTFDQRAVGTTGFSVLVSTTGKNPEDFTEIILPVADYTNTVYEKRIVSLAAFNVPVYIAFKAGSGYNYPSTVYIDKVLVEDIPSCPEPYNLVADAVTQTSASLSWTPGGAETQWEVYIQLSNNLPPAATAQGILTNIIPFDATILPNGQPLQAGTGYDYYVRAICDGGNKSEWSEPLKFIMVISNDECSNAVVVPVNNTTSCEVFATGTVNGATTSPQASPCYDLRFNDVWFKFTTTATLHTVALNDIHGNYESLTYAIYKGNCDALELVSECILSTNDPALVETAILRDVPIGETYYIRVSAKDTDPSFEVNTTFTVCVKSPVKPIRVSSSQYEVDDLVKEVLVHSECDQITNITWSSGDSFGDETGIGYFEKNGSDFPFESGIIITNGNAEQAPGPNYGYLASQSPFWNGDADLDAIILEATGEDIQSMNASIIEFDFVPATSIMSFDFIFASEEYGENQCEWSDSFAFILTDSNGVSKNLALVPDTTDPISVATIRNSAYNPACDSVNPGYFTNFTGAEGYEDLGATQFNGQTIPLTATATVVPNTQYHIKMVIADRLDTRLDSAIFLKAGSFSIGSPDLGADLLVGTNNALCIGTDYTIASNLNPNDYNFEWKKDEDILIGENGPNLIVNQPGTYTLKSSIPGTDCFSLADLKVEFYPDVNEQTGNPVQLTQCNASGFAEFDLSSNTTVILDGNTASEYGISYHTNLNDAQAGNNAIPTNFTNTAQFEQLIYARIVNIANGCFAIKNFKLVVQDLTPQFTIEDDFSICEEATATITVVAGNYNPEEVTYLWKLDGTELAVTTQSIVISTGGLYEVTVDNKGCTLSKTVTVTVVAPPVAQKPDDVEACVSYTLPALNTGNRYFTEAGGNGIELFAGDVINASTVLYVLAENATVTNCTGESSFEITINPAPAFTLDGPYIACHANDVTINIDAENFDEETAAYRWTLDGVIIDNNTSSLQAIGFGTYDVTVTVDGCSSSKTIEVTKDTSAIVLTFEEGCNDRDEYILKVVPVDGSFDPDKASFEWTGPEGFTSDKQEFIVPVKGTYIVTITTENGCVGEDFADVMQTYCDIPKGISPNGDGKNDNFDLSGLDVKKVEIFNRYGQEVYSKENYTNQWNGQANNGNDLPTGTYYYMIERRNGETKTGWVYINRQE
jgi:gliding motility-associated-like protein